MTDTAPDMRAGGGARETIAALAQLGKVRLVEIWLGPVLAWSALIGEGRGTGRAAAVCLLFVLVICLTMLASHSLDDITGFRDGSDQRNYAPERHRSQHKPLVEGRVTQRQAFAFATASVVLAASVVGGVYLLAGPRHWGVLVGGLAVAVLGAQYSYGINFSYSIPGGGELLTGLCLAGSVILPDLAVRGLLGAKAIVEGLLFGSWLVQVLACSNTTDAADDRIVGRRTVAALTSARANLVFLVGLFSASWALAVVAVLVGVLSPWTLAGLLPASAVQAYILRNGLRGVWRNKRNYGFLAVRYAVVGLMIVNILKP
jgi:1,4-dihydroxy-2-naphthoate polyprenyltransferase